MKMKKIRWGILGCAKIARQLIKGIGEGETGEVAAIASRDYAKARAWAEQNGIPHAYGSYDELLRAGVVDAIYNPLPNSLHAEWTIRALRAGLPVLCEKPFAADAAEARQVAKMARETGLAVAEAFMYRFHPLYDLALDYLRSGRLGRLASISSTFTYLLRDPTIVQADPALAGGVLMDLGCYGVNLSRLIAGGEPRRVSGFARRAAVDETFVGMMEFADGVFAEFVASFAAQKRQRAEIVGAAGVLVTERPWHPYAEGVDVTLITDAGTETIRTAGGNIYGLEADDFARALREDRAPRWGVDDAVANMDVIDALYASAREGRAVEVGRR
ncbi:MAG: gfo/Idh/MocA family oxidoreductase [Myxococcales bacterium]|nr:MAG: gfo/Idh/MocA family oxidoreductase [Myxococcales bacterium]